MNYPQAALIARKLGWAESTNFDQVEWGQTAFFHLYEAPFQATIVPITVNNQWPMPPIYGFTRLGLYEGIRLMLNSKYENDFREILSFSMFTLLNSDKVKR